MSIDPTADPIDLFHRWMSEAETQEVNDPNAVALATVDADGTPSVRMVLLKDADARGFVFFTNLDSRKGTAMRASGKAALCFHWKSLRRQIRVEGAVALVDDAEADAYFATRARGSQIGAWASRQSKPMDGKSELLGEVARFTAKFGISKVPRPPHWSGFRLAPTHIEFWRDGRFRLHDRLIYTRADATDDWSTETLFP